MTAFFLQMNLWKPVGGYLASWWIEIECTGIKHSHTHMHSEYFSIENHPEFVYFCLKKFFSFVMHTTSITKQNINANFFFFYFNLKGLLCKGKLNEIVFYFYFSRETTIKIHFMNEFVRMHRIRMHNWNLLHRLRCVCHVMKPTYLSAVLVAMVCVVMRFKGVRMRFSCNWNDLVNALQKSIFMRF